MSEEKQTKKITLKEAKMWRLICRIAFFVVAFIVPCIVIAATFHLFTHATKAKWSIAGLMMILIVVWRFRKRLGDWINSWEDSNIFKWILIAIGRVWPFILIVVLLAIVHKESTGLMTNVLFALEWTAACEVVAYLFIYPFEMKMDYIVHRMIRKNERVEDYKEAVNSMKAEEEENNE